MELARYVVDAVVLEGRSVREVVRALGVSKSWVSVLVGRYRAGGYGALEPRSRRAHVRPNRTPERVEEEVIRIRKQLADEGFDAGGQTIHWHLARGGGAVGGHTHADSVRSQAIRGTQWLIGLTNG